MCKIALITDIHNGPDFGTKNGTAAPKLFRKFLSYVSETSPDIVVDMGDRVNEVDRETDLKNLVIIAGQFSEIKVPLFHLLGNHDIDFLTKEDNESLLNYRFATKVHQQNNFSFIFWNCHAFLERIQLGVTLKEEDFAELEAALCTCQYPTVVFTHIPLGNGSMEGNFYFNSKAYPTHGQYPAESTERARELLERSGKVVLAINGHAHWNAYQCIDGIHYVTIPSLTELFLTYPKPHAAWASVELSADYADVEIFGEMPMSYRLPLRQEGHHWISMHKDYSPVGIKAK